MGNSESTVYDTAYMSPVTGPQVDVVPVVKQLPLNQAQQPQPTKPARSKGIEINNRRDSSFRARDHAGVIQSSYAGESHGNQTIKIIILGKESVGKASFVNKSTKSPDKRNCGTETVFRSMQLRNANVTFQIVMVNDDMYLEDDLFYDAEGVFLMYDTTNRESYHAIESVYLPFIKRCCPYSITKVLIASKVDGWPEVTPDEGKLLGMMNHMQYVEISTKDNINMQKPFLYVAEAVAKNSVAYSI